MGVNPFTLALPSEFENNLKLNTLSTLNSNLFLANTLMHLISKLFGKSNLAFEKPTYTHKTISEKLDNIENLLINSLKKYHHNNDTEAEDALYASGSRENGFFATMVRSKENTSISSEQAPQKYGP